MGKLRMTPTLKNKEYVGILVCGGRDYNDKASVFGILGITFETLGIQTIIHGSAKGADSLADLWAKENGVEVISCPADWGTLGRAAGPARNLKMLQYKPDLVIAFPGGRGTKDMIDKAKKEGIPII